MKYKCSICGNMEDTSEWMPHIKQELEARQICFHCNFWREQHELDLKIRGQHGYAIVDGTHYVLAPHTDSYFKGFGGREFTVKFNDGTIVKCDNMWCQGDIPEHWRTLMPDNATFL